MGDRVNLRPVLPILRGIVQTLDPAEQRVAKFVLEHAEEVVELSVAKLARYSEVSTATVMRMSRKAGFSGFEELKRSLTAHLNIKEFRHVEITAGDSNIEIARKVFRADISALESTLAILDAQGFDAVIKTLLSARQIVFFGVGSSVPIAIDAYYRLLRIGLTVSVVTDPHMQSVTASQLGKRDVAFLISHTGRTEETLSILETVKAGVARSIGLTSFRDTPLTQGCDHCLITASSETAFRVEAMTSRIAHLSVIDALYVTLATRLSKRSSRVLDQTNRAIETHRRKRDQ